MIKKIVIGLIILAVLFFVIYRIRKNKQTPIDTTKSDASTASSGSSSSSSISEVPLDKSKLLKEGVTGEEVKELQRWLNANIQSARNGQPVGANPTLNQGLIRGLDLLPIDGVFGKDTYDYLQIIWSRGSITLGELSI